MSVLTISREFGSGGREIGQGVASRLNYNYLDKEQILREMSSYGKQWETWAKGLDEHAPSIWERFDWSFRGFGSLLKSIIIEHASRDNVVIMGRGGNVILADVPHVYRIRVVAPLESRLDRIMIRESVDYDTASWLIHKTDKDRRQFFKSMFHGDWNNPDDYDEVFDTGDTSVEEVVNSVCAKLEAIKDRKDQVTQSRLALRASAAKIEAGLLTYPLLFVNTIEVMIEGEDIVLLGVVRDARHKKKVEEIARKLAGDHLLVSRLKYRGI